MIALFGRRPTTLLLILRLFASVRIVRSLSLGESSSSSLSTSMAASTSGRGVGVPKLVLVDRDGVVNEDVGAPGVLRASQLELTPGAGPALGRLRRAGCKVALITNQSCVGKGLITEDYLVNSIHGRMQEMLLDRDQDARFDRIFYCTSLKDSNDHRMKPNPGMIEEAMELFGIDTDTAVNSYDSVVFIGDALRYMEAAASGGVRTRILVQTGYGKEIMGGEKAPSTDGLLRVIHEKEGIIKQTMPLDTSDDSLSHSIFPFLYAKNFCSAVEWILAEEERRHE